MNGTPPSEATMPTFTITVARTVMQTIKISVFAGDEEDARNTVVGKIIDRDEMIEKGIWADDLIDQPEIISVELNDDLTSLRFAFVARLGELACRIVPRSDQDGETIMVLTAPIGKHFRATDTPFCKLNANDSDRKFYITGISVLDRGLADCAEAGECPACRWERRQREYSGE